MTTVSDQASIALLEGVQRSFTSKIARMEGKDYMDRLANLKMYSQERRRERYQVIFIWKICQGLVHGYNLEFTNSDRRGRMVVRIQYQEMLALVLGKHENPPWQ